jgi:hypothetical protein
MIAFGGPLLLGVIGFTLHWWLGRQIRARERERTKAVDRP